jgi:hypothetical protein
MPITFRSLGSQGRLGNQCYQASVAISLALRNNDDYLLPHCNIENALSIPSNKFVPRTQLQSKPLYEEPHFHYKKIPYKKNLNLSGYFQAQDYFIDSRKTLCKLLRPRIVPNPMKDTASLHVRRGDYLQSHLSGCFHNLKMDYYKAAMSIVGAKKYLVFSDDTVWCKKHFVGPKFTVIEHNSPMVDLGMQMACEHNIIANSSFSWWAAWLNPNPDKKVIAPIKWFGPKLIPTHNTKDLIPGGWIKI